MGLETAVPCLGAQGRKGAFFMSVLEMQESGVSLHVI